MRQSLNHLGPQSATHSIPFKLVARRAAGGAALALLPVALWCLTHRYRGLVGDAELYAVQALSRTNAGLAHDVFLSDASQDRYTIFSPIYAFFIKRLGLQEAAISLLVFFKVCFYVSAWAFSRKLFDARTALLTIALLIVVPIEYGAFHVFRVAEDMLTARSMAEALAMTGLCLHVYGRKNVGLALAAFALSIHALMALPMVLLLLSLRVSTRASLLGCAGGHRGRTLHGFGGGDGAAMDAGLASCHGPELVGHGARAVAVRVSPVVAAVGLGVERPAVLFLGARLARDPR